MDLVKVAKEVHHAAVEVENPAAARLAHSAVRSAVRQSFHLVVLGEFNRGKSSLINALLQRDVLPTDVLPTTALLHVVESGTEEACDVVYTDGRVEHLGIDGLPFLASISPDKAATVRYVSVQLPGVPLLDQGVVLIDTPGVNDLRDTRAEITVNILPYADAAIFVLDPAAPLTRSEADFLTSRVLESHIDSILFVLGKADRLDSEELEEALAGAESRLRAVLKRPVTVIPVSPRDMRQNRNGSDLLLAELAALIETSRESADLRNQRRLQTAGSLLQSGADSRKAVYAMDANRRRQVQSQAEHQMAVARGRFDLLLASIERVGEATLQKMLDRSLDLFERNLKHMLLDQINLHQGDFHHLQTQLIPSLIQKEFRMLGERLEVQVTQYTNSFQQHTAQEYSRHFGDSAAAFLTQRCGLPEWQTQEASLSDSAKVQHWAHYAISGAGVVAAHFIPLALFASTHLGALATEIFGAKARQELTETLPEHLHDGVEHYRDEVHRTVHAWFHDFKSALREYYATQMTQVRDAVAEPVDSKEALQAVEVLQSRVAGWNAALGAGRA